MNKTILRKYVLLAPSFVFFINLAVFADEQVRTWVSLGPEGGPIYNIKKHPTDPETFYVHTNTYPTRFFKTTNTGDTWIEQSQIQNTIYGYAIDPKNVKLQYAFGYTSFYNSTNGGDTWNSTYFENYIFEDAFVDPQNSNVIHTYGRQYQYDRPSGNNYQPAYFKSTNKGKNWTYSIPYTAPVDKYVYAYGLAVDPTNTSRVYIAGYGNFGSGSEDNWRGFLYRSTDGGATWEDKYSGIESYIMDIVVDPTGKIYALSYSGVYRSTDQGDTWYKNSGYVYGYCLTLDPQNTNNIYSGYSAGGFCSTDGGVNWNYFSSGLYGGQCYGLTVHSTDSNKLLYISNVGVFRSTDSGTSWSSCNPGLLVASVKSLQLAPSSPDILYISFYGNAVYKTTNALAKSGGSSGVVWERLPEFYSCTNISSFFIKHDDPNVVYAIEGGGWGVAELFMSTTGGSAWTEIDNKMDDGFALAGGSLYVGGGWEHDGDVNTLFVPAVFKTTDNGTTWERWALHTNPGYIYSIAVHPTNSSIVLAAGQRYNESNDYKAALFKTTNGGSDWTEITTTIDQSRINSICYDPFNPDRVFAATYSGVYRSTNGGTSWQSPSSNQYTVCLVADPNIKNRIFAGGSQGVCITTNGGTSWEPRNDGLTCLIVNCMDLNKQEHVLYVGTEGGGTYRYQLATSVEDETPEVLPSEFILFQNHPNPFNGETEISYQVNRQGEYRLSVIDVQGRILREFAPGNQGVGIKRIIWDGKDDSGQVVASGIYFIQLQSRTSRAVRKMIFQK